MEGLHSLSIQFKRTDGLLWWLTGIYGPASRKSRPTFWDELYSLNYLYSPCWMLGGDFNVYRWANETTSDNPSRHPMRKFNKFISCAHLIDPPQSNGQYKWSNMKRNPIMSKVDRFLYLVEWKKNSCSPCTKTPL